METRDTLLFNKLRPACVEVMKTPTAASVANLRDILFSLDEAVPPSIVEYIIFPFKMILQQRKELLRSSRFLENVLQSLTALWEHAGLVSLDTFREFYHFVCVLLGQDGSDDLGLPPASEDLQTCVLQLLCAMLQHETREQVQYMFSEGNLVMVGHCIAAILKIAQSDTSMMVKILCMDCLCGFSGLTLPILALLPKAPPAMHSHVVGRDLTGNIVAADGVSGDGEKWDGINGDGEKWDGISGDGEKCDDRNGATSGGVEGSETDEEVGHLGPKKTSVLGSAFSSVVDPVVYLEGVNKLLGEVLSVGGDDVITSSLSSFLPGVVLSLTKLITGDRKTSSLVVASSVIALTRFVAILLSDKIASCIKSISSPKLEEKLKPKQSSHQLRVARNIEWLEDSADKVSHLLVKVLGQVVHPAWRVRVAMVTLSHTFLHHCSLSVPKAVLPSLEALVALTQDTRQDVAALSETSLGIVSKKMAEGTTFQLRYKLEESLFNLCGGLQHILSSQNDSEKMATLCLLAGYLKVLGPQLSCLANSHIHLSSLTSALLHCLKVDTLAVHLLEERVVSSFDEPASGTLWSRQMQFVHFNSCKVAHLLYNICDLLGYHCPLLPLIDHILEVITTREDGRCEGVIMLGHVLLGAGRKDWSNEEKGFFAGIVQRCVEVLLRPEIWNVSTQMSSGNFKRTSLEIVKNERTKAKTLKELGSNIALVVSALSSLRMCAVALGKDFNPHLMSVLYPLLQRLGDISACVSHQAYCALQGVVECCGYESITDLLQRNADYLVSAISVKLRRLDMYPEAAPAMTALLQYGSMDVLPLVTDSVDELLYSLDLHREDQMDHVWPVLEVAAQCAAKKTRACEENVSGQCTDVNHLETKGELSPSDTVCFFKDYWESSLNTASEEDGIKVGDSCLGEATVDETQDDDIHHKDDATSVPDYVIPEKELSLELKMAVNILERSAHYLPVRSDKARLTVLSTVYHCIVALQFEENSLLPQVHKMWPSFVKRFSDSSVLVTTKAVELLNLLTKICKDFLRRRVSKELWTRLTSNLKSLASESRHSRALYHQTHQFKLQKMILEQSGHLCRDLSLSGADAEMLVQACVPYLSPSQPPPLQSSAVKCLKEMAVTYPDTVWFVLVQLTSGDFPSPPTPTLKPLAIARVEGSDVCSDLITNIISDI